MMIIQNLKQFTNQLKEYWPSLMNLSQQSVLQSASSESASHSNQKSLSQIRSQSQSSKELNQSLNSQISHSKQSIRSRKHKIIANSTYSKIDYGVQIEDYMSEVNRIVKRSLLVNTEGEPNEEDKEVNSIINEVLSKRRKQSRRSDLTQQSVLKPKKEADEKKMIVRVNQRIEMENRELQKKVRLVVKKLKKLEKMKINRKQTEQLHKKSVKYSNERSLESVWSEYSLEQKKRQLQKLKKRVEKAELNNSKLEKELSQLSESRRSTNSKPKNAQAKNRRYNMQNMVYQIHIKPKVSEKGRRKDQNQNCVLNSFSKEQVQQNIVSPLKNAYFSPIMQFSSYSLKNEPTISLYENNEMQQTSHFAIAHPKDRLSKQAQSQLGGPGLQEEVAIDQEIKRLEQIVKENNAKIAKYEEKIIKTLI